jgi:molybdopterin/thiamine biosynthesis adenylyltransferase
MSANLIALSPDLLRLQLDGYELEVRTGVGAHLLIHGVPYVNAQRQIARGTLVSPLTVSAGIADAASGTHQAWFVGDHPCNVDGSEIAGIKHSGRTDLGDGIVANHGFSAMQGGKAYPDYYAKMVHYIEIIEAPARSLDASVTARTFRPIVESDNASIFHYADTASSRARIGAVSHKLAMAKIAIIGLGGTGSYILDLVAKTHVQEIHLFDGDRFCQHNAFRAPGAPSAEELSEPIAKAAYFAGIYSKMRRGIVPHAEYITDENVQQLADYDFVFVSVDRPAVRKLIAGFLHASQVPFIDVGMDVRLQEEQSCLYGQCRTTLSTPAKHDHYAQRVPLDEPTDDEVYSANIQIADLNALNATLAVIKWKKYCGFYQDLMREHESVYAINAHLLTKDEKA